MTTGTITKREWCKIYAVLIALCLCYFGKYFCTSDMYVAQTPFTEDEDISSKMLSNLFAVGYFTSMFGKVAAGALCDAIGGRFVVLLSAIGYATSTLVFSFMTGFTTYVLLWGFVGFFALGLAWVAIVNMATNWIPKAYLGRLMGLVSMAPQLGDATARLCLAQAMGFGWRAVFQLSAGVGFAVMLPILLLIPNQPASAAAADAAALAVDSPVKGRPAGSYFSRVKSLLGKAYLWVLCLLSGSLYGTRVLFLLYSTTFLGAAYCKDSADVHACTRDPHTLRATAGASSSYTLLGCVSVLLVGWMKDNLPTRHRGATLVLFVAPLFAALSVLSVCGPELPFEVAAVMVGFIGFTLFGPYKVLGAVFAVDVGGKELKSTCTAMMGVFDNFFAILMLLGKGALGDDWGRIFGALTCLSAVSLLCASCVWISDICAHRRAAALSLAPGREPLLLIQD